MKVLHISESGGFSGGVNQAIYLARILKEKGVENYFASPADSVLRQKTKGEFVFFNFTPTGTLNFKAILNLKKLFEEEKFNIVHAHHPKAHHYALLSKKISGFKPIIVVSRRVSYPIPPNPFAQLKYKSMDINAYIAVCEDVKKILINYGIDKNKIYLIYSGVDTKRFKPEAKNFKFKKEIGLNENDFVISLVGNFSDNKGQLYLIKAAKILYKKGFNFKLLFAGAATDGNEMKNLFIQSGISLNNGIFLGLRNDVERILNITDISVNASIKGEALSGSIRESLACGISVIASNISGNVEIVKDHLNGFLYQPGNYEELAQKLEILITNEDLRKKFSKKATLAIEDKFTAEKTTENILNLYTQLLARK